MTKHRALFLGLYAIGAAFLLGPEFVAIFNDAPKDTITENVREFIGIAPIVWYVSIGTTLGFGLWFMRHMWWGKR